MKMLNITFTERYQLFYLKKAIHELGPCGEPDIHTLHEDHFNGCNYINSVKVPLTFPKSILEYTNTLDKTKELEYNFIGTITEKRSWIHRYKGDLSVIRSSVYGRDNTRKYTLDQEYYRTLSRSKFTLTPTGDCPWSYRFFEAIMCLSIPVVEKNSNDIFKKDYFYYVDTEEPHIYNEEKARQNYDTFIHSKHFLDNVNEIIALFNGRV